MVKENSAWEETDKRKIIKVERLYLFFGFPNFLGTFTWVNAVVQGAEILGLIQGSGFVVSKNFPLLTMFYFSDQCEFAAFK